MSISVVSLALKPEDVATAEMVEMSDQHEWFKRAMGEGLILVPVMNRMGQEMTKYVVEAVMRGFPSYNPCSTEEMTYRNRVRLYHSIKYVSEQTQNGWNLDNSYGFRVLRSRMSKPRLV